MELCPGRSAKAGVLSLQLSSVHIGAASLRRHQGRRTGPPALDTAVSRGGAFANGSLRRKQRDPHAALAASRGGKQLSDKKSFDAEVGAAGEQQQDEEASSLSIEAEWNVAAAHHRLRVDRYVLGRLKAQKRAVNVKRLRKAMREGRVTVNAKVVSKPDFFVKKGDKVRAHIPPAVPSAEAALAIDWGPRILYEDGDVLVVDKPAGVASAPSPGEQGTHTIALLEAFLSARDAAASAKEGLKGEAAAEPICLSNVHRLDKDTSGVLLLSKNAAASAALGREFKGRRVRKSYWAAMYGHVQAPMAQQQEASWLDDVDDDGSNASEGDWEPWNDLLVTQRGRSSIADASSAAAVSASKSISSNKGGAEASGGMSGAPKARKAALSVRVLQHVGRKVSIVAVRLNTGRLHQIRVQGASRGHFVLGDNIYGEPRLAGIPRLCLHCGQMSVAHPSRPAEVITAMAPLPSDLVSMVEKQEKEAGQHRHGGSDDEGSSAAG